MYLMSLLRPTLSVYNQCSQRLQSNTCNIKSKANGYLSRTAILDCWICIPIKMKNLALREIRANLKSPSRQTNILIFTVAKLCEDIHVLLISNKTRNQHVLPRLNLCLPSSIKLTLFNEIWLSSEFELHLHRYDIIWYLIRSHIDCDCHQRLNNYLACFVIINHFETEACPLRWAESKKFWISDPRQSKPLIHIKVNN